MVRPIRGATDGALQELQVLRAVGVDLPFNVFLGVVNDIVV
jgi:hypothetical protein